MGPRGGRPSEAPALTRIPRLVALVVALTAVLAGCAGQAPAGGSGQAAGGQPARTGAPKKLTAAVLDVPGTLSGTMNTAGSGSRRGVSELELLVSAGMVVLQGDGSQRTRLEAMARSHASFRTSPSGRWRRLRTSPASSPPLTCCSSTRAVRSGTCHFLPS